jgi:hypothetical protein
MRAAPTHLSEFPTRAWRHVDGVAPMTSRSTYPICTSLATAAFAAMLLIAPIAKVEAGEKGSGATRDHRGSIGKVLQCQGNCVDRHVRDQVAPRWKNIAGPNPIVRDHRGTAGPRQAPQRPQRGWTRCAAPRGEPRNCWGGIPRDHRNN